MSNNIEGKVVVITGASSGLGEATARHLSAQGATVVLGARRGDRIESLAAALSASGGKALAIATDVTHCDQVKRLVDAGAQTYGRIDVMINNAGLMPQAPLERLKIDEWERMIDVNIKGVLYGIAAALPHMKRQKAGISSTCRPWPAIKSGKASRSMRRPNMRCAPCPKGCGKR
jgi:NADP-dependent 3-hydroxy acid dehydrogenase YdfG